MIQIRKEKEKGNDKKKAKQNISFGELHIVRLPSTLIFCFHFINRTILIISTENSSHITHSEVFYSINFNIIHPLGSVLVSFTS